MSLLVLVTASRTWPDVPFMERKFIKFHKHFGPCTLLSGHCHGGDLYAEDICKGLGWDLELHPANWTRYGNAAGYVRNRIMVNRQPNWCLAFIHNKSRGAMGCLELVKKEGIKRRVYWRDD